MDVVEIWKPVLGFEDRYEVSSLGQVRGKETMMVNRGRPYLRKSHPLVQVYDRYGYKTVGIGMHKKFRTRTVHSLVLEAFSGARPDGYDSCHLNGIRDDNRIENLKWGTKKENSSHKHVHGTDALGEKSVRAKLTYGCVDRIRDMDACGLSQSKIGSWFGVEQAHVSRILRARRWGAMSW
jgi:hypothetical protein